MHNLVSSKIRIVYTVAFVLAAVLMLAVTKWQLVDASRLSKEIEQRRRERLIPSVRGAILARDGSTLAYSEPRFDLYIYLPEIQYAEIKLLQTRDEFVAKLAPYLTISQDELKDTINKNYRRGLFWFKIADGLTLEQRREIESLKREKDKGRIEGISLQYAQQRFYPEKQLAGSVIGFTDPLDDGGMIGRSGIEADRNGVLEPQKGYVTYDIDAAGNPVAGSTDVTVQAKRGSTIVTTLDKYLQKKLEEGLKAGLEKYDAKSASGIIMDPKTGEIWALANYPTYDPNTRKVDDPAYLGNAAVSQPYEIGSVGKVFTLSAIVNEGKYGPNDIVMRGHEGCELLIEGFKVCNLFGRKSGALSLVQATVNSDNVAYYHMSRTLGADTMYKYLRSFGVGSPSGVDLSREESYGYIKTPDDWNLNDISAYSYGTSFQMNMVQAISAVGAVANNGTRMQPYLVKKIIQANGSEIVQQPRPVERVMSEESSKVVGRILYEVFKSNLIEWNYKGWYQYPIAMKSGTGLIVKDGRYSEDFNATYVGFDISSRKRFIMMIRLDSPKVGRISSENARTVWLDTFNSIHQYLGY